MNTYTVRRTIDIVDAVTAGLLAHAAGDSLGAAVEFSTPAQIRDRHGTLTEIIGGGPFGWRPGQPTDDTDQTLIVADSYLHTGGGLDLDDVGRRLLAWIDSNPPDVGGTTRTALTALRLHHDPTHSGQTTERSAGNGSLMRALTPGLVHTDSVTRRHAAAALSAITHAHPDCIDACVAYAELTHRLLEGLAPTPAVDAVLRACDWTDNVTGALNAGRRGLTPDAGGTGGVIDSLHLAVAALVTGEHDGLEAVLIDIVNRGGDADTNAAIAGGLLGARHGTTAIPHRWVEALEQRQRLVATGTRLAALARTQAAP